MTLLLFYTLVISSILYFYLHKKTKINIKYLFIDNIIVGFLSFFLSYLISKESFLSYLITVLFIFVLIFTLTMLRFWRTPQRKIVAANNEIVSPADGNIIYIKKIEANEIPISIKKSSLSKLSEITKTELLKVPCWLIGINMTPFDVHKNCSPIDGKIILNKHFDGKYLSLKNPSAISENERNTYVIANDIITVGVIQIASKRVRRIDTYVKEGELVKKGDWIGMIRFGSQVDLIVPEFCKINVSIGEQVHAKKTKIAMV